MFKMHAQKPATCTGFSICCFSVTNIEISDADQESFVVDTVRSYFPETWLWDIVPIGYEICLLSVLIYMRNVWELGQVEGCLSVFC